MHPWFFSMGRLQGRESGAGRGGRVRVNEGLGLGYSAWAQLSLRQGGICVLMPMLLLGLPSCVQAWPTELKLRAESLQGAAGAAG